MHWYALVSFTERPFGEPVDPSRAVLNAHGCVDGNDLRTRALGLSGGGGIPFASRALWTKGLQSQDLYIGDRKSVV